MLYDEDDEVISMFYKVAWIALWWIHDDGGYLCSMMNASLYDDDAEIAVELLYFIVFMLYFISVYKTSDKWIDDLLCDNGRINVRKDWEWGGMVSHPAFLLHAGGKGG